jgi:hypothetical protein
MDLYNNVEEARKANHRHYFTGKPCKHGHIAKRTTRNGVCVECTAEATRKWFSRHKDKPAEYTRAYRARDPIGVYAREKAATKARKLAHPEKYYKPPRVYVGKKLPIADVVARLFEQYGDTYTYVGGYVGMEAPAMFRCNIHDRNIEALPHNTLRGAIPCPQCNHMKSAPEESIARFLAVFTPVVQRDRTVLKPRELDIYMPEKKLAVEFNGMYHHTHHTFEHEQKNKHNHFNKWKDCQAQGIRLITIYESEWLSTPTIIKRLLRNAIGKSRGRLMARKCELRKVSSKEARPFYEKYHPQGGSGSGEHYALFWKNKMVACMRFVFGANDRGSGAQNAVWTLGRYATRITVAGAASRLFNAFLEDKKPEIVKSFSDNRYFGGGMYEALGFTLEADVPPDYQVWSQKLGFLPKPHYQRRMLQKRLKEHGFNEVFDPQTDPRTEREMTYYMGAGRIFDCGKKRWIWTVENH